MAKTWNCDELLKVVKACLPSGTAQLEDTTSDNGCLIKVLNGNVGFSLSRINEMCEKLGSDAVVAHVHGLCSAAFSGDCVRLEAVIGGKKVDEEETVKKTKAAKEAPSLDKALDAAGTEEKHKKEILKDV